RPNPGRGSTYRRGKSVQTTGTTSLHVAWSRQIGSRGDQQVGAMAALQIRPIIAAAGGVNAQNAAAYAAAGADLLVTSAPYLARPCDVQ
ncbi:MAG: hypothetical protein ACK5CS_34705, partial [Bradyrhizobium sp.]